MLSTLVMPTLTESSSSIWTLIPWLFHRYKYVGEKIAFGIPGGSLVDYHKRFLDFHKSFFFLGQLIMYF
jgi:hypothetical protein